MAPGQLRVSLEPGDFGYSNPRVTPLARHKASSWCIRASLWLLQLAMRGTVVPVGHQRAGLWLMLGLRHGRDTVKDMAMSTAAVCTPMLSSSNCYFTSI